MRWTLRARETYAPEAYGEVVWFGRRGAGAKSKRSEALRDDGGKRAVLRGEHEVSRKAIAQGRPECSRCPVCSCAVLFAQIARETAGAASTRSSLRPPFRRGQTKMQTSGDQRRENAQARQPSLRAQRSNPSIPALRRGLLRCARNDGERPGFASSLTVERRSQRARPPTSEASRIAHETGASGIGCRF